MRPPVGRTAGEELSYDYRFAGEEQLRCNCGAAACRGMVNQPPRRIPGVVALPDVPITVPAAEVRAATAAEQAAWRGGAPLDGAEAGAARAP